MRHSPLLSAGRRAIPVHAFGAPGGPLGPWSVRRACAVAVAEFTASMRTEPPTARQPSGHTAVWVRTAPVVVKVPS